MDRRHQDKLYGEASTLCVKFDESACVTKMKVQGGKGKPEYGYKQFYQPGPGSGRYGNMQRGDERLGRVPGGRLIPCTGTKRRWGTTSAARKPNSDPRGKNYEVLRELTRAAA